VSKFLANLTTTEIAKGKLGKVEQLLREIFSVEVFNINARRALVGLLADQGRFEEALTVVRDFLQLTPDLAVMHWLEGNMLIKLKKYGEAEVSVRRALSLDDRLGVAYDDLLFVYIQWKDKQKAIEVLERHSRFLPPESEKARKVAADLRTLRTMP